MSAVGIDLGSATCYVAATKTRGIETLDNDYSDRRTPCYISFTDARRFCGTSAFNQAVTNAPNTVSGFRNLLGLKFSDPNAQREMALNHTIKYVRLEDDEIGLKVRYLNKEEVYTPIQLVAMMLNHMKESTMNELGATPNVVLSCPMYFSSRQRRALAAAAHIANINLMGIINDTLATSITYGLYNTFTKSDANNTTKIVLFIDVGYSSTQVFLTKYESNKIAIISSVGSNRFGGRTVDNVMAEHFANEFYTKYKADPRSHPRAWLKLINEMSNVKKKVNSSNSTLPFGIECFLEDHDLVGKMSRDEMAQMCKIELEQEVLILIDQAIKESSVPIKDFNKQISSIEIVGGSTRLVMIKNLISSTLGVQISNTLNCDEAVARGCALYCAKLTPTIQIKPFDVTDLVCYDVKAQVYTNNQLLEEVGLFKRNKQSPCTCLMSVEPTCNFRVVLQQLVYPQSNTFIDMGEWNIRGVSTDANGNAQKVKVRVRHDQNSYVVINQAQMFEIVDDPIDASEQVPLESVECVADGDMKENEGHLKKSADKKLATRTINLTLEQISTGVFSEKCLQHYCSIENAMIAQVAAEKQRTDSKNAFEELIYNIRDKLDSSWREFISESNVVSIKESLTQQQDWLYDEGDYQPAKVFLEKLAELRKIVKPIEERFGSSEQVALLLNEFNSVILHYNKILGVYADAKVQQYKHIPNDMMAQVNNLTNDAIAKVSQAQESLRAWNKTTKFPLKIQDLYKFMNEYKQKCEAIVNLPVPPPEKPVDESGSDSPDFVSQKEANATNAPQNPNPTEGDVDSKAEV